MKRNENKPSKQRRRADATITLQDVARLAGVSAITASRALSQPELVSGKLRRRVDEVVRQTGYVPNRLARGLASARSRLVAAVIPTLSGPAFLQTVDSLASALAESSYQLMLGQSSYVDSHEDDLLRAIISRRPDAVVLTGVLKSSEGRRILDAAHIPIVETWDLNPHPMDMMIGFSHEDVGRQVALFLHRKGHRRLAIVAGDDERSERRCFAYCHAAQELGLGSVHTVLADSPTSLRSSRAAFGQLLGLGKQIDAVFCSSDLLALGVMTEARARGIDIPGQLAVVGFGDNDFAADLDPALTTVRIDAAAIGRGAASFIVRRLAGLPIDSRIVDVGFSIVERRSA